MTENKNPDVVRLGLNAGTKYFRAEPVKDLLKQARDKLDECARDAYDSSEFTVIIHAINKFLEGK